MPRERQEFIRVSDVKDSEKMFLLAYEGNETEPTYFEDFKSDHRFNNEIVEIVSLRRPKDDTKSAPKYVFERLEQIKTEYDLGLQDELWMIIDKDRNKNNIEKYYKKCCENNFFFALSNPCFELWLLLHIKDLSEYSDEELRKIEENKKITPKSKRTFLEKLLMDILDGYNKSNLKSDKFLPNLKSAIARAKALRNPDEDYPTSLGTDVYKLMEKLIK